MSTTFFVDLRDGYRATRTSKTRTYTHAVVTENAAWSWHRSEDFARKELIRVRRRLADLRIPERIRRDPDTIAVVPCAPLEPVVRQRAVAADRKALAKDPSHVAKLLNYAEKDVANYTKWAARDAIVLADLEANVREICAVPTYNAALQTFEDLPTEVVLMPTNYARDPATEYRFVLASRYEEHLANFREDLPYHTKRRNNAIKRRARLQRALARLLLAHEGTTP